MDFLKTLAVRKGWTTPQAMARQNKHSIDGKGRFEIHEGQGQLSYEDMQGGTTLDIGGLNIERLECWNPACTSTGVAKFKRW